jgi:hypothetical protein
VADRYHTLGVKHLRTHDYNAALDIGQIYPDLTKDPTVSGSLNFTAADNAFAAIVANGFTPFLRLGNGGGQQPGSDWHPDQWGSPNSTVQLEHIVQAMVAIVARYTNTSRWELPATHVEVWNEPNEPGFWNPAPKSCVEGCTNKDNMTTHWPLFEALFMQAVAALKQHFPHVKVGGPGFAVSTSCTSNPAAGAAPDVGSQGVDLAPFVEKLVREKVPLDFISWHTYSNNPTRMQACAREIRTMLPPSWEMYVSEWNLDIEGPFNATPAASIGTATWVGLQARCSVLDRI